MKRLLVAAGFSDVRTTRSPFEIVLPEVEAWIEWLRSMEFGEYLARMDEATLERFRLAAANELPSEEGGSEIRFRMDALLTRAIRSEVEGS